MATEYRSADWDQYSMVYHDPHRTLEPPAREMAVVEEALSVLVDEGILPHTAYDQDRMLAHRAGVAENFEIPWTAISPRMQRLLYAVNAIHQPRNMIAAGVFCGNTFFSNAGAGAGPGKTYEAAQLIGIEILPDEAARAEANVRKVDPSGVARVVAADAVDFVADFPDQIDLLYLDADGDAARGKGIYHDILMAGWDRIPEGGIILAHNSVNCAERLAHYLGFVRDPENCRASVNVIFDPEGLEVSVK